MTCRGCAKALSGAAKSKIAVAPKGGKSRTTGKFSPRNPIIIKQAKIPMLADSARRNWFFELLLDMTFAGICIY